MIILILLTYLPVLVCMLWMFNHTLLASKTKTYPIMMSLLVVMLLYTFTDCAYGDSNASSSLLLATSNLAQLVAPCVLPLTIMYLRKLRTGKDYKALNLLWIVVPVALFTSVFLISRISEPGHIEGFLARLYNEGPDILDEYTTRGPEFMFFFNAAVIFRVVLALELIAMIISYIRASVEGQFRMSHLRDFFFRKGTISVVELQYYNLLPLLLFVIVKILLFRSVMISHPWVAPTVSVLFSLVLSPFCFGAMFSAKETVTLQEIFQSFRYNYSPETMRSFYNDVVKNFLAEFGESGEEFLRSTSAHEDLMLGGDGSDKLMPVPSMAEELFGNVDRNWDKDSLMGRLEHLMMEENAFLQPGLMLSDVAERLGTNKTYISRLVNSTYKMSFPDLVNYLRVHYVQEYLISHRGAKQNEIAEACGFTSASSLNNTFKRVTGITPRIWLTTYERSKHS